MPSGTQSARPVNGKFDELPVVPADEAVVPSVPDPVLPEDALPPAAPPALPAPVVPPPVVPPDGFDGLDGVVAGGVSGGELGGVKPPYCACAADGEETLATCFAAVGFLTAWETAEAA